MNMSTDKTRAAWIADKLHGRPVETPPGEPVSRDKMMSAAIHDKLQAGPQPISDPLTAGDQTDPATGGAPDFDQEARDRINDPEILAALDNPDDELHSLAKRIYDAYVKIAQLVAKAATPAGG
jgi:hypothetical protein